MVPRQTLPPSCRTARTWNTPIGRLDSRTRRTHPPIDSRLRLTHVGSLRFACFPHTAEVSHSIAEVSDRTAEVSRRVRHIPSPNRHSKLASLVCFPRVNLPQLDA